MYCILYRFRVSHEVNMKKQIKYQEVIDEIKKVYADYQQNPERVLLQKEHLIEKIKALKLPWHRKECLGFMLLACLEALFSASKSDLLKSKLAALKVKSIDLVQDLLKIYPEIALDKEGSGHSYKVQNF
jgi:hypothetical protein